ncbi:hypothetical protein D3C79_681990 [compost metagenome]
MLYTPYHNRFTKAIQQITLTSNGENQRIFIGGLGNRKRHSIFNIKSRCLLILAHALYPLKQLIKPATMQMQRQTIIPEAESSGYIILANHKQLDY